MATVGMRMLPPEAAHRAAIAGLKAGFGPGRPKADPPELKVRLGVSGLELPNPVGLAAGFDKDAEVFTPMLGYGFGFVECGTVTPLPQAGNEKPRLFRLTPDQAVINRMGFNNQGLDAFVRRLDARPKWGVVGANVGANKTSEDWVADYVAGLKAVWAKCSYVTMNISSPNTPGLRGLQEGTALEDLLGATGEAAAALDAEMGRRPVFLKVAPDLDERAIGAICDTVRAARYLDGLIVSNTTIERPDDLASAFKGEAGGLSGAPLMEKSTEVLAQFATALGGEKDLIGAGGIASGSDVWRKLAAGAQAVQLYSALVYGGPGLVRRIKRELLEIMRAEGVSDLKDVGRSA